VRSNEPTASLTAVLDREQIRHRLAQLSRGLDRRDATMIRACYWPGATDDQGVATSSVDDLIGWVVPGDPAMVLTLHTLGQSLIEIDGDRALIESHVTAYHRVRVGEQDRDVVLCGRYLDQMEKRGDEWRISHRKLLCDWQHDLGPAADWSQGLFGMPFTSEDAVGKVDGDYSQAFFTSARR
jgi:SnoaL-like domain